MKSKLFILSTMITTCMLSIACYAADNNHGSQQQQPNPTQQPGSSSLPPAGYNERPVQQGGQPCYPASRCIGNPYASNYSYQAQGTDSGSRPLSIQSSEQFVGSVKAINRVQMPDQTQIQMVLSTDRGDLLVIVGPSTYIDQQKIKFQAGDQVTVTGYRVTANGQDVIVAASIQKNGNSVQLLDEKRQPVWGSSGQSAPYAQQGYASSSYGPMSSPSYSQGYSTYQRYSYSSPSSQYGAPSYGYSQNPSYSQSQGYSQDPSYSQSQGYNLAPSYSQSQGYSQAPSYTQGYSAQSYSQGGSY